jgi:hypothetical protein
VGIRSASSVYGFLQEASKISQDYYPERMGSYRFSIANKLGKFFMLNAPWGFSTVWSIIKRWLDPVTVSKISILGSSYQSALLEQIPAENLPSKFGGKCQCKGGCELSDEGPWQDPQWLAPQVQATDTKSSTSTEPTHGGAIGSDISVEGKTMHAA